MSLDKRRKKADDEGAGEVLTRIELFVNYHIEGILSGNPNARQAAIRAGYSAKSAHRSAYDILKRQDVQDYIAQVALAQAKRLEISGDRTIKEYASIGYSPIIPGYISANDKLKALDKLGVHQKLWEGSKGNKVLVFNLLPQDEKLL